MILFCEIFVLLVLLTTTAEGFFVSYMRDFFICLSVHHEFTLSTFHDNAQVSMHFNKDPPLSNLLASSEHTLSSHPVPQGVQSMSL